ncbi:MAG: hypothetical protein ACXV2C_03350 [Candidatus Bathyarchaeia archaeon]
MNRKVLGITLVLMVVFMLATSLVETAQACGPKHRITKEPYSVTYVVTQIKAPNPAEVKGDYKITTGAIAQGVYSSPLGTGTMTAELMKFVVNTVTGEGWQYLKNTLVITSGPFGAGTLVGFSWFKFDSVIPPLTTTSGGTFLSGQIGCNHVTIIAEKGYTATPKGTNVWEEGWMVIS